MTKLELNNENLEQAEKALESLRPNTEFSSVFAARLRSEIEHKARGLSQSRQSNHSLSNLISSLFMNKAFIPLAVVAGLAVITAAVYVNRQGGQLALNNSTEKVLSGSYAVSKVGERSFGNLILAAGGRGGGNAAMGMGGDSSRSSAEIAPADPKIGIGGQGFIPETYRFVYKGGDLPELAAKQSVFRRVKNIGNQDAASRIVRALSLGLVDLNKFRTLELQNFTINENRDYGYNISVSMDQGSASISQNWLKWPQSPLSECRDEACLNRFRFKAEDVPDDATLISIAKSFVEEYDINVEAYGEPVVNDDWRRAYETAPDKSTFYVPDAGTVVYPLRLNGQQVLDEGGNLSGMMVNIDLRVKRVTGVYEINTQRYEESAYDGETNAQRLIELAERGGWRNYYPLAENVRGSKISTVDLGTPTIGLMRVWQYQEKAPNELYVPALIFPVITPNNSTMYMPKQVMIPLVKELLDEQPQPPVTIMDQPVSAPAR
jgi:hypothetical protein